MSRRPANVTQAGIARALRAVKQSGLDAKVEIRPNGSIMIIPASAEEPAGMASIEQGREIVL